ncbi:unnamed protein product [Urochloa humidicola]
MRQPAAQAASQTNDGRRGTRGPKAEAGTGRERHLRAGDVLQRGQDALAVWQVLFFIGFFMWTVSKYC